MKSILESNLCAYKFFLQCLKDLDSTVAKRGSVFIGLMTPDGAIWSDIKGLS